MITTHQLPADAFAALASGDGDDLGVVQHLRAAQQSKHLMLLHLIRTQAEDGDPASPELAVFRPALKVLATVQEAAPAAFAWLFGLPHIGAWAHDCLEHTDRGSMPDFGYLASAAAAAAVRGGVPFELDVPTSDDGKTALPGLGYFEGIGQKPWVRLRSDGERLVTGTFDSAPCAAIAPNDGSAQPVPHWHGSRLARVAAGEHRWSVLLETSDPHLDRFGRPVSAALTGAEAERWRTRLQSAWELLVRHHGWTASAISAGVSVIVPLAVRSDTDLDSATTPAAFGAIATSRPPDPVIMAEILVHEFQHLKLCGLLDMVPLLRPCDERVYAPWRQDPRPAGALLQGVYAHLGVTRFWNIQRHVEMEPSDIFRAQVMFERWRSTIEPSIATLLRARCLTAEGIRFVAMLRDEAHRLARERVPAEAKAAARDVALDHWLSWQLSHMAASTAEVADLAAVYQRGEPLSDRPLPEVRIEEGTRKVLPTVRSQVLRARCHEPGGSREQGIAGIPGLSEADGFLLSGQVGAAVHAYRDEILTALEPVPEAWVGLAFAAHLLEQPPSLSAFASHVPLMFDVHACLLAQGVHCDPMQLAAWFS